MDLVELIGWIGGVLLATCGLPQVIHTYKVKNVDGLSLVFVLWWWLGEFLMLVYVATAAPKKPIIFNLIVNIFACMLLVTAFILWGKKRGR